MFGAANQLTVETDRWLKLVVGIERASQVVHVPPTQLVEQPCDLQHAALTVGCGQRDAAVESNADEAAGSFAVPCRTVARAVAVAVVGETRLESECIAIPYDARVGRGEAAISNDQREIYSL